MPRQGLSKHFSAESSGVSIQESCAPEQVRRLRGVLFAGNWIQRGVEEWEGPRGVACNVRVGPDMLRIDQPALQ